MGTRLCCCPLFFFWWFALYVGHEQREIPGSLRKIFPRRFQNTSFSGRRDIWSFGLLFLIVTHRVLKPTGGESKSNKRFLQGLFGKETGGHRLAHEVRDRARDKLLFRAHVICFRRGNKGKWFYLLCFEEVRGEIYGTQLWGSQELNYGRMSWLFPAPKGLNWHAVFTCAESKRVLLYVLIGECT